MRKFTLSLLISSISLISFSQSKNVQNAYIAFKQEKDNIKTKITEAKHFIDLAYESEETSNNPKMWYYRSQIYLEIFDNHPQVDDQAIFKATEAYIRCLDRDKRGKIVVKKQATEEQILDGLYRCGVGLYKSAEVDFGNGNYELAIKKFNEIFKIIPLDKNNLLVRSNITNETLYFNMSLAAENNQDKERQLEYLNYLVDLNTNNPRVYYKISFIYKSENELQKSLDIIKKGLEQFPSEIELINLEIDLLREMGSSSEDIIKKLTDAIDIDNSNETLYIIRSQLYQKIGKIYEAESDLLEALDINSESASANNNLASFYLSLTEPIVNELNDTHYSKSKKISSLEMKIDELHKKALPFLIKYTQIIEKQVADGAGNYDKAALDTLATLYYGLGMEKESKEVRNFLNSLK